MYLNLQRSSACPQSGKETLMHIRANKPTAISVNPYAAAAEKATAVHRAAAVRRKPAKNAARFEDNARLEQASRVFHWMDSK
jgi:hypothetical protein